MVHASEQLQITFSSLLAKGFLGMADEWEKQDYFDIFEKVRICRSYIRLPWRL